MASEYFKMRMAEINREQAEIQARREAFLAAYPPPPPKLAPKPKPTGYVYFLRAGNVVKIGFTTNLRQRWAALRIANPETTFICHFVKGTQRTEREFHKRFSEYRVRGEWFDIRGRLAKYLERYIYPVDLPEPIKPDPEPEIEIRL